MRTFSFVKWYRDWTRCHLDRYNHQYRWSDLLIRRRSYGTSSCLASLPVGWSLNSQQAGPCDLEMSKEITTELAGELDSGNNRSIAGNFQWIECRSVNTCLAVGSEWSRTIFSSNLKMKLQQKLQIPILEASVSLAVVPISPTGAIARHWFQSSLYTYIDITKDLNPLQWSTDKTE